MKESLYGIILEPPTEATEVLRVLEKLKEADVDYIMPKPGTVAVLGKDLFKVLYIVKPDTPMRVTWEDGSIGYGLKWYWTNKGSNEVILDDSRNYSSYGLNPEVGFTFDNSLLFTQGSDGIITEFSSYQDVLKVIHEYGFTDGDIRSNDHIWNMANRS